MSLKVSKGPSKVQMRLTVFIAVLALLVQPMYGLVAGYVANAADTADVYVNQTIGGDDATDNIYATINAAIAAATDGDVISVAAGTYKESVQVNKNVTLRSESGATATVISVPATSVTATEKRAINLLADRDGVVIEGFTLNGALGGIALQANSNSAAGFEHTNLVYKDLIINANGGAGLGLFDVNGIVIDNVRINGANLGVEAVGVANLQMSNSAVTDSTVTGVNVWHTAGYEANDNLTFTNNTFTNNMTGIKVADTANVAVNGGTFTGGSYGIWSQGSSVDVDSVNFNGINPGSYAGYGLVGIGGTAGNGPFVTATGSYSPNVLNVSNSTFTNNGRTGALYNGSGSTGAFSGNTYVGKGEGVGHLDYAAVLWYDAQVTIEGNTVRDNLGRANAGDRSSAFNVWDPASVAIIRNNTITNNTMGIVGMYDSTITAESNNIEGNIEYGAYVQDGVTANFEKNWWGDKSGPSGEGAGTGDAVSRYTTFSPWLCAPAPSTLTTSGESCDKEAPTVAITSPSNGASVSGTIDVLGTVIDDEALSHWVIGLYPGTTDLSNGLPHASQITVPGWGQTNTNATSVDVIKSLDTTDLDDGEYQIRLAARDAANNRDVTKPYESGNTSVHVIKIVVDNTPPTAPTFTVDGLSHGQITNQYSITSRWDKPSADIVNYEYNYWNDKLGNPYKELSPYPAITSNQHLGGSFTEGDGIHHMRVRAFDAAGNASPWSNVFTLTYDSNAPDTVIHSPANGEVVTGPVDVVASIDDANLSHYWLTITRDGSDVNLPNTREHMYTDKFTNRTLATLSEPGVYVVKLEARDKANNKDDGSTAVVTFTISEEGNSGEEPTDPPVDPTIAIDHEATNGSVVKGTATPGLPIAVSLLQNGVSLVNYAEVFANAETGVWSIPFSPSLDPGTYTVRACNANDLEPCDEHEFTVAAIISIPFDPNPDAEVPVATPDDGAGSGADGETNSVAALFFPATFGGINLGDEAETPVQSQFTPTPLTADDEAEILGAEDVRKDWSVVNAALAGIVAVLAVVALAGIRRKGTDNNTGARLFMIVPAAAAVVMFFIVEGIGGSMAWFNVWTWLFAGILVVQAILATLTTRTASDR